MLMCRGAADLFFHFLNAHIALFQADKVLQPFDVMFVEDAAVVRIPFDVGDKSLVAIKFQGLIGHIQLPADLHHRVHSVSLLWQQMELLQKVHPLCTGGV